MFCFQSVPGVGGDKKEDEGLTREELQEQERLRYKDSSEDISGKARFSCEFYLLNKIIKLKSLFSFPDKRQ